LGCPSGFIVIYDQNPKGLGASPKEHNVKNHVAQEFRALCHIDA
jgi:hypothetical protein